MFYPEDIIEKIESASRLNQEINLFICHSNLHALQALSLQKNENNICLYNEAVSIKFMQKHFKGKLFSFNNEWDFSKRQLFPVKKIFQKRNNKLHVFLGNKQNFWSTFIVNQLSIKDINILDDGLSSYGVSQELYWEKSNFKKLIKKVVKHFFSIFRWHYFHESNNSEINHHCTAYYFFPDLIQQPPCVTKIQLDSNTFHSYSNTLSLEGNTIHIASYKESKLICDTGINEDNIHYILHPRVVGKAAEVPTEILLYRCNRVFLAASSLILYLVFIGYKGEYVFKEDDIESKRLLSFFQQ